MTLAYHYFPQSHWSRVVSLVGKTYVEEGKRATPIARLDRVGPSYGAGLWDPGAQPEIPRRIPLQVNQIDDFWSTVAAGPIECLVIEEKGRTRWFSPTWGLVRDVNPAGVSLDLMHASIVR